MKIEDFLNNELVDFASYSTLRAIPSAIDGLKNSTRKVLWYMQNNKKEEKVSILAGKIMSTSEYLHGDISGSIITLAQNYPGSNNIPFLTREGNFGSRFTPGASASRYIFTSSEKYLSLLFRPEDNHVLIEQEFEGTKIEPRFFVPTLPMLLVNGSEGIATGFASKILPRNPKDIVRYIENYLNNKKLPELKPWFRDTDVNIVINESQVQISGKFNRIDKLKIEITELPIGYTLDSYNEILDKLEDQKIIKSYEDISENDKFRFIVKIDSKFSKLQDDKILQKLKLIKNITENYTVIDEDNRVKVFNSIYDIINYYIDIKLKYLQKRKDFLIEDLNDKISFNTFKAIFIKAIVDNKLIINKRKKKDIEKDLENYNIEKIQGSYDYLLRMPLYSLTIEKLKELKDTIQNLKSELKDIENTSIEQMWLNDLKEFKGYK